MNKPTQPEEANPPCECDHCLHDHPERCEEAKPEIVWRETMELCPSCGGKGFHNWAGDETCQQCNGTGRKWVKDVKK